jgi:hypothetical protein
VDGASLDHRNDLVSLVECHFLARLFGHKSFEGKPQSSVTRTTAPSRSSDWMRLIRWLRALLWEEKIATYARICQNSPCFDIILESLHNFDYILVFHTPRYAAIFRELLPWCFRGRLVFTVLGLPKWPARRRVSFSVGLPRVRIPQRSVESMLAPSPSKNRVPDAMRVVYN